MSFFLWETTNVIIFLRDGECHYFCKRRRVSLFLWETANVLIFVRDGECHYFLWETANVLIFVRDYQYHYFSERRRMSLFLWETANVIIFVRDGECHYFYEGRRMSLFLVLILNRSCIFVQKPGTYIQVKYFLEQNLEKSRYFTSMTAWNTAIFWVDNFSLFLERNCNNFHCVSLLPF